MKLFAIALSAIAAVQGLIAQGRDLSVKQFDVVSVKLNTSGTLTGAFEPSPDGMVVQNFPLTYIIQESFGIRPPELAGPDWLARERYDIHGKTSAPRPTVDLLAMVRGTLATRFHMKWHWEPRPIPVYALTVDDPRGTLGPNISRITSDCAAPGGCPYRHSSGSFDGSVLWTRFVQLLTYSVDRKLVDETGLSGSFRISLQWTPGLSSASDTGTGIFTAVKEQLGMSLVAKNAAVDILVIDRIERPSPD